MMNEIDLDINNYSINDIEKFFQLDPNRKYTPSDLELKEYEIREQLLSSGHINKKTKRNLIDFLTTAKQWLVFTKFGTPSLVSTNPTPEPGPATPPISRESELIARKDTPYVHANNSEFFAGNLNPLNTRIITKCLAVDTRFRENLYTTKASDFIINLPSRLNKVVSMQLSSIELPITFYGISASYGNNFLYVYANTQFFLNGPVNAYDIIITIPDGNYTALDLIDTMNTLLCPTDASGNPLEPNSVFSYIHFVLDITSSQSGSGRVKIEPFGESAYMVNSIGLDFTKNINGVEDSLDITSKLGWNLGFTQRKYFGSTTYTSETVIDTVSMRYVYLGIEDYQHSVNNLFINAFHNTSINENVLARIALNSDSFTILMENNLNLITEPRRYFGPVDIQKLRIRLFDDHGRVLDINNSNFSFVLIFKMMYDL